MQTFSDQRSPSGHSLVLDLRDNQDGPLLGLFDELQKRFGDHYETMRGIFVSPADGNDFRAHQWKVNAEQFGDSFGLLQSILRDRPAARGRVCLRAWWQFKFADPETSQVLAGQDDVPIIDIRLGAGSSLTLNVGSKTSVNAWFLFPFEFDSPELLRYGPAFEKSMIFKFSPKHWRKWCFSKGEWRPRKFVPAWHERGLRRT